MKILIQRSPDRPGQGRDERADLAIASGRIIAIGTVSDFGAQPRNRCQRPGGCAGPGGPGSACASPGRKHAGHARKRTGRGRGRGVTSLVCPPDTEPVLDEPGLVEMLKFRAESCTAAACSRWVR
jgi:dihydroorotase